MTPIKLFWWRHRDPAVTNVGDAMNPPIVEAVSGRPVVHAELDRCDLIAIGSVMEIASRAQPSRPITVWGSGFIKEGAPRVREHLDIVALRGPASALQADVPVSALGDPGLFADLLIPHRPPKRTALGVVPHYVDLSHPLVDELRRGTSVRVISPLLPVAEFVTEIAQCDAVLSSSLHGLVVADALAVPNRWIEMSDAVIGAGYKFRDYLGVFGLTDVEPLRPGDSTIFTPRLGQEIGRAYARPGLDRIRADLAAALTNALE